MRSKGCKVRLIVIYVFLCFYVISFMGLYVPRITMGIIGDNWG